MWGALIGAGIGAAAGGQKDVTDSRQGVNLAPESELERQAGRAVTGGLTQLQGMVGAGPGQSDVGAAVTSQRGLADMLKQYAAGGFLPGEQDMATAQQFATSMFAPQAIALKQQFGEQQQQAAQLAARMGRPVNDPILQAKMRNEQMQQQERLGASQGAFAQQFAMSLPQQRLGYTSQAADVQNALASQAMANRQALLSLGSQVQGQERNWRLGTAERYGTQSSGGGLKGAITGAMGGAAGFMGLSNAFAANDLMQAQTGFYQQAPGAMVAAAGAGRPVVNNYGMGGQQQAFSSPMGQPNVGPQLPASTWAANTSSIPYGIARPESTAPNFGTMGSIMQGVGNTQFTPQFAAPAFPMYDYMTGQMR